MTEFLNELFSSWAGVVRGFAGLAAITLIVVVAIATKLAWGRIVMTTIVAAFVLWAVTGNGLGWFSEKIGEETATGVQTSQLAEQAHTTIVIYETAPADPYALVS